MPSRSRGAGLFTLRWRRQGWFSSGAAHWPRIVDILVPRYEVPADKAAVPVNHALGGEFGTVGSLINSMLAIKKDERDKGIDRAAELKVVKESIEGMYANVQAMLEEAGEIPQVIMAAFDHLSIQWGPEEEENGAEDAAEEV
ncbi:unnamed protein product [Urochloa humidicola]